MLFYFKCRCINNVLIQDICIIYIPVTNISTIWKQISRIEFPFDAHTGNIITLSHNWFQDKTYSYCVRTTINYFDFVFIFSSLFFHTKKMEFDMNWYHKFSFNENQNPIKMIQLLQNLINLEDSWKSVNSM